MRADAAMKPPFHYRFHTDYEDELDTEEEASGWEKQTKKGLWTTCRRLLTHLRRFPRGVMLVMLHQRRCKALNNPPVIICIPRRNCGEPWDHIEY